MDTWYRSHSRKIKTEFKAGIGLTIVIVGYLFKQELDKLKEENFQNYINLGTHIHEPEVYEEALSKLISPNKVREDMPVSVWDSANELAEWMQEFEYYPDPARRDLWYPPTHTLNRKGGDCEDLAMLATSAGKAGGLDEIKVVIGRLSGQGHAWVEGIDVHGPFLLEATDGSVRRTRPSRYQLLEGFTGYVEPSHLV